MEFNFYVWHERKLNINCCVPGQFKQIYSHDDWRNRNRFSQNEETVVDIACPYLASSHSPATPICHSMLAILQTFPFAPKINCILKFRSKTYQHLDTWVFYLHRHYIQVNAPTDTVRYFVFVVLFLCHIWILFVSWMLLLPLLLDFPLNQCSRCGFGTNESYPNA